MAVQRCADTQRVGIGCPYKTRRTRHYGRPHITLLVEGANKQRRQFLEEFAMLIGHEVANDAWSRDSHAFIDSGSLL